jgi:hypothetical protein
MPRKQREMLKTHRQKREETIEERKKNDRWIDRENERMKGR